MPNEEERCQSAHIACCDTLIRSVDGHKEDGTEVIEEAPRGVRLEQRGEEERRRRMGWQPEEGNAPEIMSTVERLRLADGLLLHVTARVGKALGRGLHPAVDRSRLPMQVMSMATVTMA